RGDAVLPSWKGIEIRAINRNDIANVLDPLIIKDKPYTANRAFAAIRQLLGWCVTRELIAKSPADGIDAPGAEQTRDRVLADTEIKTLWSATDGLAYPWGAMTRLLLLTAQRR